MDFDEINPAAVILGLIGGAIAFFTASGGFSGQDTGVGSFMKLAIGLIGFVVGYVWGNNMS